MKEIKARQKGFLALLLAAVIVLAMPGMTVFAGSYHVDNIHPGMTLAVGDEIYTDEIYESGGLILYDESYNTISADTLWSYDTFRIRSVTIPYGYWIVTSIYISPGNYDFLIYVSPTSAPSSPSSGSPAEGYYRSLKLLTALINLPGGDTHYYSEGTALTYDVLKTLADNPEDTLIFETEYEGYRYKYTIHGYDVKGKISPEIPWYGPYWLAQNFFETTVIEPLEPITPVQ